MRSGKSGKTGKTVKQVRAVKVLSLKSPVNVKQAKKTARIVNVRAQTVNITGKVITKIIRRLLLPDLPKNLKAKNKVKK